MKYEKEITPVDQQELSEIREELAYWRKRMKNFCDRMRMRAKGKKHG